VTARVDGGGAPGVLASVRRLKREGRTVEALSALRDALRREALSPEEIERAGHFILREITAGVVMPAFRVLILGQCTTSWLKNALAAVAWARGDATNVGDGGYDAVLQNVASLDRQETPAVLVLLPWNARLLQSTGRTAAERIDFEIAYWRQVWRIAAEKGFTRIIHVGYDWVIPDARGFHLSGSAGGDVRIVRTINDRLREELPAGNHFLPLEEISGTLGRAQFYDQRRYFWTKQPFSEAGSVRLAEHLLAALRAITVGHRKVLVLDLDNTLWGGIVGELGAAGVAVGDTPEGEAFVAFQRYLKSLSARGILLAVCSKNDPDDAREPFLRNPNMVLTLDDFVAFEANWQSKPDNLRRIARTLRLSLDSFVFFDDSKAEQEQMRQALAEVAIVNTPADPADYVSALQDGLWFETAAITSEDETRSARYAIERQRRDAEHISSSLEDYLGSLDMRAFVQPVTEEDLPRVVQLLSKTNQFNLTTRRHSRDAVRSIISRPGSLAFTLRLRDRFGDYGLVAVVLAAPASDRAAERTLSIDTFLMSCRIIGRTAEHFLIGHLLREAGRLGYKTLRAEYIATAKNRLVDQFYPSVGFTKVSTDPNKNEAAVVSYELDLDGAVAPISFLQPPT
jgi:FkbH-like protein